MVSIIEEFYASYEVTKLLTSHLRIENALIRYIESHLKCPSALKFNELRFPTKVGLAVALGALDEDRARVFLALNSVRNKIAHRSDFVLDDNSKNDLIDALTPNMKRDFIERLRAGAHTERERDALAGPEFPRVTLLQLLEFLVWWMECHAEIFG